jgi:hypothetical protein
MEVFAVTVFVSLAFAVLFAVLFFAERSQRDRRSIEQDALLPLDDTPRGSRGLEVQSLRALASDQVNAPIIPPVGNATPLTAKALTL